MNPTVKKTLIVAALVVLGAAYASKVRAIPGIGKVIGMLPGNG